MKRCFSWLLLGALPALSQVPERQIPQIAIYYGFEHDPPDPVLRSLEREVDSILSPAEPLEWRSLAHVSPGDVSVDLAVVNFKGSCDVSEPRLRRVVNETLGRTHVTDGIILPFCEVNCDRIGGFLKGAILALNPDDRDAAFGRAVGRVVAHELYHIFAKTPLHHSEGVAKSSFTVKELMAGEFRLNEAALALQGPLAVIPGSPKVGRAIFVQSGCDTCHGPRGEGTRRAPAVRAQGRLWSVANLAAKLAGKSRSMTRRGRELKVEVHSIQKSQMDDLVSFLNSALE